MNIEMWVTKVIKGYSACLSFFVVGIVNQNQSETVIYVQHPITLQIYLEAKYLVVQCALGCTPGMTECQKASHPMVSENSQQFNVL